MSLSASDETQIRVIYQRLLDSWNTQDAQVFAAQFMPDAICVGFDGTVYTSARQIAEQLAAVFADHMVSKYVSVVRSIAPIGEHMALLQAVAGMTPPKSKEIKPEYNAVHVVVLRKDSRAWRIVSYQNTLARYDGRPEDVKALTAELQALVL